jgi:hypothetical protein
MTTEEKQNFLREKILDKGYDTNQFVQFLTEKKGEDGADVSNWSMEDLVSVVNEFIKLNGGVVEPEPEPKVEKKLKVSMFDIMGGAKPKKNISQPLPNPQKNPQIETQKVNSQPQTQTQNQPKVQKPQTTIKPTYNNTNTNNNMTGAESEYGIITQNIKDCKPLEQTELAKFDNLEITISKPEKKTEGFFSKTYVTYMVTTLPASYIVRRRYTDFVWLRSTLQNHFPSNVIPPIPKKSRLVGDNFSTQFISKRQRGLEKFMRYLAKDPIIKNSQIFFDFLYIGAESDFNSKKKVYEKVKTMTEVDDFRNKDAKVEIMISGEKENYVENIKDNVNMNITLFKKLNGSFKLLFDEINNVTNRMDEIAGIWEQIYKLSQKYYDDNITCESYKQMSNLFSNWSKILKDQNSVVNIDIREHFKFLRKNFVSMKDLANSIETYKYNYTKASRNLISKKDDLFRRGDSARWELDPHDKIDSKLINNKKAALLLICKKETKNVIGLKEFYGLYLNRVITEYERMRNLNGIANKNILNINIKKLTDISGKFLIYSGEINSALDSIINDQSNDGKCKMKRIPMEG